MVPPPAPIVVAAPVRYVPVVAPAPVVAPCRARVVHYVHDHRRIAQPMVHGAAAVVEVRAGEGYPWVVVGPYPSIW